MMYPELNQVEVVFVHKLASGEPTARARALRKLHKFIEERSKAGTLTEETLTRLSKGLHYAMWMQDKPILQEDLAANIASIMDDFETVQEAAMFVKVFIQALSSEWHLVDRWRMDKFLMMMRILVRKAFSQMADSCYAVSVTSKYLEAFHTTVISASSPVVESIKSHFASICWSEYVKQPLTTPESSAEILNLYLDELRENQSSDFFFDTLCEDILETLIRTESSALKQAQGAVDELPAAVLRLDDRVPLDAGVIGKQLFEIGSMPAINGKRRKRLYQLSKKFLAIDQGKDPEAVPPVNPKEKVSIPKSLIIESADKLLSMQARLKKDKIEHQQKLKAMRKQQQTAGAAINVDLIKAAKAAATAQNTANQNQKRHGNKFKAQPIAKKAKLARPQ